MKKNQINSYYNIAIVIGSKGVNATGMIRSLGQAGYYVIFASTYSKIESKWTNAYWNLPKNKNQQVELLQKKISTLWNKPAIFPTDDETAYLLDDNFERLKDICYFSHANGKLRSISDKTIMAELANVCGLNVPCYTRINLLDTTKPNLDMPLILKPYAGFAGCKGDIRLCYTQEELDVHLAKLKQKGYEEVMAQQLLESPEQYEIGLMGFCLQDGTVEIPCTIRKIRSYPSKRGSTSFAKIKAGTDIVDKDAIKRFVKQSGYVGIFDIEMIVSKGQAYFIEINYRNGQYGYAPTAAGYNIPHNWIKGMKGQEIDRDLPINEIYYINERDDFRHVKSGEISLKQWLKEFHEATAYGMFCPGDQRPYIRQYFKMPDRVKIFCNKVMDYFKREEWNVAYRIKQDTLLYEEGGNSNPFIIMPNTFRYWAADPFVIKDKEKDYIFFEMYDRFKQKGVIGYRTIENGIIGKMKVAYEAPYHLSFPYVFVNNGDYYMLPEASNGKKLVLLKAERFPDKWNEVKTWMEGIKLCDSIIMQNDGTTYLFTQQVDKQYLFDSLYIYKYEKEWKQCCNSPIVLGSANARMAGNVIRQGDTIIRVSQDCYGSYGRAITFNKIQKLTPKEYDEVPIRRIEVSDIQYNQVKKPYAGIHTYNLNENYEVIDLKKEKVLHLGNIIYYLYRLIAKR